MIFSWILTHYSSLHLWHYIPVQSLQLYCQNKELLFPSMWMRKAMKLTRNKAPGFFFACWILREKNTECTGRLQITSKSALSVLTKVSIAAPTRVWTHRTAFARWDYRVGTVEYILALYLVTKNGSIVTDTDLAGGRMPNVPV